jgi:hypothetical protein
LQFKQQFARVHHRKTESLCGGEVGGVKAGQPIGVAVQGSLQHHVVRRIAGTGTPQIVKLYRLAAQAEGVQKGIGHRLRSVANGEVLRSFQRGLVLQQLSRYGFEDSIRDGVTLPLHFEPRLVELRIDKAAIDQAYAELTGDLSDLDRDSLAKTDANMAVLVKAPERVAAICQDIAKHFQTTVAPNGFKAMVVTFDQECIQFLKEPLALAGDLVAAERETPPEEDEDRGKAALTALFEECTILHRSPASGWRIGAPTRLARRAFGATGRGRLLGSGKYRADTASDRGLLRCYIRKAHFGSISGIRCR